MPDPKSCILRNFAAFNAHDTPGVVDTYTQNCELVDVTASEPVYGHSFLREHMANLLHSFPDIHIEDARLISEGHIVAGEFALVGTHHGEFLGYPASGNVLRWRTCSIFELTNDDERIKREAYYYDLASVTAQLRLPAP